MNRSTLQSLHQTLDANSAAYRRAVQSSAPGQCWDFVVLTAANEKQAAGYRQELALRHRAIGSTGAFFPAIQRSLVVADPPGRRAGSGGATFGVMRALQEQFDLSTEDFDQLRILLIHSGGASQRLPMYSPVGKIFSPLPLLRPDGQIATLFDHLYLTLAGLPERLGPGMLVLAGDVFLMLDHRQVTTPEPGVTALSMRVDAELGTGHGVFAIDKKKTITQTLQKVSIDTMKSRGATDSRGQILIDTGLLFFDAERAQLLAKLSGPLSLRERAGVRADARRGAVSKKNVDPSVAPHPNPLPKGEGTRQGIHERHLQPIDLYEDITEALAAGTTEQSFLADASKKTMRRELWKSFHGIPFKVMELSGEFLHLGTTLQFREAMVGQNPAPAAELFQQDILTHAEWPIEPGRRVFHSVLLAKDGNPGTLGESSVVEHCILAGDSTVGRGSVVSQVLSLKRPLTLAEDRLLFQVPVREGKKVVFVHVYCGVQDDFKGAFDSGKCLYCNEPIERWLASHHASPDDLWPGIEPKLRTLWNARMFVATKERDASPNAIEFHASAAPSRVEYQKWKKSPRFSMAMILEQADAMALIEHREVVSAYLQACEFLESIQQRQDLGVDAFVSRYQTAAAYEAAEKVLRDFAEVPTSDPVMTLHQSRALWCITQLQQRPDYPGGKKSSEAVESLAVESFARVAKASELGNAGEIIPFHPQIKLTPKMEVTATAPVRLDLAGGWSDTPPYCFERGGNVINLAINLDGHPPIRAIITTIAEPKLILESHDLGARQEITQFDPNSPINVRDPFALHRVALQMTALLPHARGPLKKHFQSLGAGLRIVTESRVPKGSGLGTSSILAAVLLAALHKVTGVSAAPNELIEQTLTLEQRLSTGGGWQDQVGGVIGGMKSTLTWPGFPQQPFAESLALSESQFAELEQRLVVYYSGQQRLARDILRQVMGRWIAREPSVVQLQDDLKTGAGLLRKALLRGDWPECATHIARYWQIKKELYPGSTTPAIDRLFLDLRGDYLAAGLAGAGGGGFGYFFCESPRQAQILRDKLTAHSNEPGSLGSVYPTQINRTGLMVSVRKTKDSK